MLPPPCLTESGAPLSSLLHSFCKSPTILLSILRGTLTPSTFKAAFYISKDHYRVSLLLLAFSFSLCQTSDRSSHPPLGSRCSASLKRSVCSWTQLLSSALAVLLLTHLDARFAFSQQLFYFFFSPLTVTCWS